MRIIKTTSQLGKRSMALLWVLPAMLLVSAMVLAESTTVYKTVNPDGSITYSDQPSGYAEKLEVQPVPTVPAIKVPRKTFSASNKETKRSGTYTSLEILSPGHDTAFYSGNGDVNVSVLLEPALSNGHQFQYSLDGRVVATQAASSLMLNTLDRGTHSVSVAVIDRESKVVLSRSSTFTVHRPSVNRP